MERAVISQRILFAKIKIIPKGQFPKIKAENAFNIRFVDDKDIDFSTIGREESQTSVEVILRFIDDSNVKQIHNFQEKDEFENEDPMDQHRLTCVETTLISKCPHAIVDDENIVVAPGEGKAPLNVLKDEKVEVLAFPDLFPTGKFGLSEYRDVKLTHTKYFNQRLLNYTQRFASDSDYLFFANFVSQQTNLHNQMNVAMREVSGRNISAGMLSSNFKENVKNFVVNEVAYTFMNSVKVSAAYWKNMLSDVLAMVKQLEIPSFFMTLSCADLRWNELPYIISRLNGQELSDEEIIALPYFERCELLNSNPVLLVRHFQYRVEVFYKEIVINGPLGKVKFHVIRIEFQFRGSPHAHCLLWVENMPVLTLESIEEYTQFLDSAISANIPTEPSRLKELVEQYQVHRHSKTCQKYGNKECRFGFGKFFTHRTIIAKPLPPDTPDKDQIRLKQKEIFSKVKNCIDEFLNPQKRNFLYLERPNYENIPNIDEVLESLDISLTDYEVALSISTDENDFQVHLKRNTNSCFVNNYFEEGLLAWQANIDLQPVFNHYKAVQYMCAYFSKNETSSSNAMKEALAECKELEKDKFETMQKLAQAYSDNRECSVQEAVYQLMPELWLRKGYPQVMFVNTHLPEERFHMFKSEEELVELPEDSEDVFKKNILDRYIDRPNRTFSNGKYREIDSLCYAQFCSNFELDKKNDYAELINDSQPNVLDDTVVEENHVENPLPKKIPLMNSKECMRCRKVRKVLRTYTPNRHLYPEKYAHHLLMLFYPFRKEEDLKLDGSYMLKLSSPDVLEKVNRNREIFEPNSELVESALQNYRSDLLTNQNAFAQQENDEVFNLLNEELDNNTDIEEELHNDDEALANLAPAAVHSTTFSEEELRLNIESLNEKQREIFDVVYMSIKRYVQNKNLESPEEIEPLCIFLTAAGGCGKSYLLKCLYDVLNKLLCRKGDTSKAKILRLAPTGVAAINIDGTTIHTGLGLSRHGFLPLSDKQRTNFRLKLQDISVIFIDEVSMVSPQTLLQIHQRLCEIFGTSDRIPFANKTVIVSGDLYQLPPVFGGPVFTLNGFVINLLKLWRQFKFAELNEVMRQQGDNTFVNLLNNIRIGIITEEDERILRSKFISQDDPNYPWDALHLFAENSMVKAHNDKMIETLSTPIINIFAIEQYPRGLTESKIQEIRNKKYTDTGAYARTVHKVQGLTLQKIVVSFQLNQFKPGQMYVALSRVTSLNGLFLIGDYSSSAIKSSKLADEEYERLRCGENILEPLNSFPPSEENLVLTFLNIRSLRGKSASLKHHKEVYDSDVVFFAETQINCDSNIEEVEYNMKPFTMIFNNDTDKFKSLAIGYKESISILEHEHLYTWMHIHLSRKLSKVEYILHVYQSSRIVIHSS
ncbi:uncharacterized protein [Clytia hemisphaerica]|uniref:uncharacterized protein n=1 Tax=Clytia hemisphaerica TaxID=252671 RepID=UPI0034D4EDB1